MHPFAALPVPGDSAGIHWFGQNPFALKDPAGMTVLIDPFFPHDRPREEFVHAEPPLNEADLPTGAVLLTHDHLDHVFVPTLARIHAAWPRARFYGPTEAVARLRRNGFAEGSLATVHAGDVVAVGTMTAHVTCAVPPEGAPDEGTPPPECEHVGYVVQVGAVRVYNTGDIFFTFARHEELLAPVRALRPDIGLLANYPGRDGALLVDSVRLATRAGLRAAVPAHYACFVQRDYDPRVWAALFPQDGPRPVIMAYDTAIVYPR